MSKSLFNTFALSSESQRPFFNQASFKSEEEKLYQLGHRPLSDIKRYIDAMYAAPHNVGQHELAIESIIRLNGFDPNHDRPWLEAEFAGGRAEVVGIVQDRYLKNVLPELNFLGESIKYNQVSMPFDCEKESINGLYFAVDFLQRAYCERDRDAVNTDMAWEDAGVVGGLYGLRVMIQDMFVTARVGAQFKPNNIDDISRQCADALLRDVLPNAADSMGISLDIKQKLLYLRANVEYGQNYGMQPA